MPTLKQLACQVEWSNLGIPFKEYGIHYGDGIVECYIAVPNASTAFAINLKSKGYISSGLAMFIFIDGVYQCNRNRVNLRPANDFGEATRQVDFRVRQKEELLPDGSWIGRPWRFEPLQIGKLICPTGSPSKRGNIDMVEFISGVPDIDTDTHFDNLGSIQVLVLRCNARTCHPYLDEDDLPPDPSISPESAMAPVLGMAGMIRLDKLYILANTAKAATLY